MAQIHPFFTSIFHDNLVSKKNQHKKVLKNESKELINKELIGINSIFNNNPPVFLTPYNYKGGQKYTHKPEKLTISLDYFQFSILSPLLVKDAENPPETISFGEGVLLVKSGGTKENGIKDFKCCYELLLYSEIFLQISTSPRASIIDANLSTIKVENCWLYRTGYITCLEYVLEKMNATIKNISRLDIAVDGGDFLNDFTDLLHGKYLKLGKAKMSVEYKHDCTMQGGYIGSRSSDKFCRIYNKTEELANGEKNKTYIKDFWVKNGLDKEEVERLEITLKTKAIRTIKNFDWTRLEDNKYLAGIMKSQMQKLYVLIPVTGESNKSRREKIQPCFYPYFDAIEVERLPTTKKPNITWRVKRWVTHEMQRTFAFAELNQAGQDLWDNAFARCYQECKDYGILDWYKERLEKWEKDKKVHELMRKKIKEVKERRFRKRSTVKVQYPI